MPVCWTDGDKIHQPVISGTIESLIAIVAHGVVDCRAIGPIDKGGLATCHLETCDYVS